jgi:hypothetical protein
MKRLRIPRSISVVRRRGVKLAALAAGLIALTAFAAVPASARHADGDGPDPGAFGGRGGQLPTASGVVNFRRMALFTCFGANGGTPTSNTANITSTLTTVKAVVTVHAPPFTTVYGQLDQSGCAKIKFFSFTIPASGVGTFTVTDLRVSRDAFVWFNDTAGDFQITPEVVF